MISNNYIEISNSHGTPNPENLELNERTSKLLEYLEVVLNIDIDDPHYIKYKTRIELIRYVEKQN